MDTDMAQKETGKQEILTQGQVKPPFTGPENDGSRPQEDTPGPKQTEQANKWAVLVIVAIGVFMATLDSSIVNISLPAIARSFGVPLSGEIEWVIIAYLVVTAGVLLTAGRISDMIGRKAGRYMHIYPFMALDFLREPSHRYHRPHSNYAHPERKNALEPR